MKNNNLKFLINILLLLSGMGIVNSVYSMGLRSFVALPVEKGGSVIRLTFDHAKDSNTNTFITSAAYGFTAKQTLLLGLPYRLSPTGSNRQGDISVLYRQIVIQKDRLSGTDRLGLLGGAIIPTEKDRETAVQAGFVFTHVKNRYEIDLDALYREGTGDRVNSGLYDLSWQYRLLPIDYPDWGIAPEINSVLELNGRWSDGDIMTHQLTAGLQWIHQAFVIEGGIIRDINNEHDIQYILSTRFHF